MERTKRRTELLGDGRRGGEGLKWEEKGRSESMSKAKKKSLHETGTRNAGVD